MSFAEIFMALMLHTGVAPGISYYSQTPSADGGQAVVRRAHQIDALTFRAYELLDPGDKRPAACDQGGNPHCDRPHRNPHTKRWERAETFREGLARYWQISQHAGAIATSLEQLEYMYVIVKHESGNGRRDVHEGSNHRCDKRKPDRVCRRKTKLEDAGKSWCLAQVMATRHPGTKIPDKDWSDRRVGELVGIDDASTQLCIGLLADRVRRIMKRCGRKGRAVTPACVFLGYAGSVKDADHPLIAARIASHAKVRRANRELGPEMRKLLGLPPKDKQNATPSVSFAPCTSTRGPRLAIRFGSAWTRSRWAGSAWHSRRTSYGLWLPTFMAGSSHGPSWTRGGWPPGSTTCRTTTPAG